jgi:biotin transport system substrate-specific component
MTQAQSPLVLYPSLSRWILPQQTLARDLFLVLGGSLVVALLAQVAIPLPFTPVPITGQTLGVLLVGASLGWRLGLLALLTYLVEGAIGLPVFAGGGAGFVRFLGPTGGYLLAYPLAAALMGFWVERFGSDRNVFKMIGAMILCSLIIYGLGSSWLGVNLALAGTLTQISSKATPSFANFLTTCMAGTGTLTGPSVAAALCKGVIPFIPGDLIKIGASAALLPITWRFIHRPQSQQNQGDETPS